MNWNNLKNYKCPKDGEILKDIGHYHACTKCIFTINKEKFNGIVNSKYSTKSKPLSEEGNLEMLNNDGREEISESFLE